MYLKCIEVLAVVSSRYTPLVRFVSVALGHDRGSSSHQPLRIRRNLGGAISQLSPGTSLCINYEALRIPTIFRPGRLLGSSR